MSPHTPFWHNFRPRYKPIHPTHRVGPQGPTQLPASRNLVREMSRQTRTCKKPPRDSRDKKNVIVLGIATQRLFQSQLTFVLWQGQQRRRRSQQILQKRGGAAVLRQLARFHQREEVCSGSEMQNLQSTLSLRKKKNRLEALGPEACIPDLELCKSINLPTAPSTTGTFCHRPEPLWLQCDARKEGAPVLAGRCREPSQRTPAACESCPAGATFLMPQNLRRSVSC